MTGLVKAAHELAPFELVLATSGADFIAYLLRSKVPAPYVRVDTREGAPNARTRAETSGR